MIIENTALEYTLPIWQIFGVLGHSMTSCQMCSFETRRAWREPALYLDIVAGDVVLWRECLDTYFSATPLDDKDDRCENGKCGGTRCRSKQEFVDQHPPLLVIVLKRWVQFLPGVYEKEDKDVLFPMTLANDDLYSALELTYSLRSVVEHIGAAGAGHYVCYTKNGDTDWFFYDDLDESGPRQCNEQHVLKRQAFILCYDKS